jgi:hypothetical protein
VGGAGRRGPGKMGRVSQAWMTHRLEWVFSKWLPAHSEFPAFSFIQTFTGRLLYANLNVRWWSYRI